MISYAKARTLLVGITVAGAALSPVLAATANPAPPRLPGIMGAYDSLSGDCSAPLDDMPLAKALDSRNPATARLSAAAAASVPEHTESAGSDGTAWIAGCGVIYYRDALVDPAVLPEAAMSRPQMRATASTASTTPSTAGSVQAAKTDVFALSSRPKSNKTIYLDFTGHTARDSFWNDNFGAAPITSAPFTFEGGSTFTDDERLVIATTWAMVAEDYAAFDVNVTTKPPAPEALTRASASDNTYGVHVVFTNDNTISDKCSCQGIAPLDALRFTGANSAYLQPSYVFALDTIGIYPKILADVASHEIGHNTGLEHDGIKNGVEYYEGHDVWGPIMGGAYETPLVQWSAGQYRNASNTTQDDLAIIAGRIPRVADDADDTPGAAKLIFISDPAGASESWTGLIGARVSGEFDKDLWAVRLGAEASLSVEAVPRGSGPNLDLAVQLIDIDGRTVLTQDAPATTVRDPFTASGLGARINTTVPQTGRYYVLVKGTGQGEVSGNGYSAYGSIGTYKLTVSSTGGADPVATDPEEPTDPQGPTGPEEPQEPGPGYERPVIVGRLPVGTVGIAYKSTLTVLKGEPDYTWLRRGTLPPGLKARVSGTTDNKVTVSGRPTKAGTWKVTFFATDRFGKVTKIQQKVAVSTRR